MSEIAIAENSVALLDTALDAAGGLERWREHSFLSAHLSQGGGLWEMKGQAGVLDDVRIDVALHQEWVSHHPFGAPELRSSFTPRRVEIRDGDGTAVEALDDPRPSFSAHVFDTPWTRPQLAYFVGTAIWTYLTQPFCFALPGFRVEELPAQREDGKALRRLRVEWPAYLASHSSKQTLYFDDAGRLARHDYEVEIIAGAPAAHLFDGFVSLDGITLPTRHRIHTPPTASTPATSSWRSTSTTSRSGSRDPSNTRRLLISSSDRALLELRSRHLRPRDGEEQRTTASELFFDLVFVFAVTQLSHLAINGGLRVAAMGRAAFLLVVVWWAWIYTTWMVNWFDPRSVVVRVVLLGVALASLLMSAAIPTALTDHAALFAGAYVARIGFGPSQAH